MTTAGHVALWATPRTVSTAFERMVIERGDHLVLDEPFSRPYYFGPERRSDRFPLSMPESTFAAVRDAVVALCERSDRPVFVKDMAYQVLPAVDDRLLDAFGHHTFLVREPAAALASFGRGWPDFSVEEAGYAAQHELFDRVRRAGCDWSVVDSDDLRADPAAVVAAWEAEAGLDHCPDALRWDPGMRPEWPLWHEWYATVAQSTGFEPPDPSSAGAGGAAVDPAFRRHYEALAPHRL